MNFKVLGGAAVVVLGVGGFLAYEEYQKKKEKDAYDAAMADEAARDAEKEKQKALEPEKQAEVPDLKGMSEDDAKEALKKAGFVNATVQRRADNYVCEHENEKDMLPLDTICEQDVGAGVKRLVKNLRVQVTIERDTYEKGGAPGYEWHRMPDLEGLPLTEAKQLLADKGFGENEFELKPGSCDDGIVCDTIPDGGQRKRVDSQGTLKVGGYRP